MCILGENIALLYSSYFAYEGEEEYATDDQETPDLENLLQRQSPVYFVFYVASSPCFEGIFLDLPWSGRIVSAPHSQAG